MDNRMIFDKTSITQLDEKQARNDVFCYLLIIQHFKILRNYDMNVSNC